MQQIADRHQGHDGGISRDNLRNQCRFEISKDLREHIADGLHIGSTEHDPAEADDVEGDHDTDTTSPERHIGSLRFESWDMGHKPFVHGQGDPVPSSPQNESPCGAVPESSEQHGDNQVDVGSYVAFAVSSKRNVEVVFQPAGEGDVPAAPEFGDGRRFIGGVEVFVEMEAEQPEKSQ